MSWVKRIIRNWLNEEDSNNYVTMSATRASLAVSEDSVGGDAVLNFKVYSAIGGKVVEFRRYDRQRDRNECQTYIITNDQDFGSRIASIATMENLKS